MPVTNEPLAGVYYKLVPDNYDTISATYPTSTQEVYAYSYQGVAQATVTVTYTDSTKENISTVVRS